MIHDSTNVAAIYVLYVSDVINVRSRDRKQQGAPPRARVSLSPRESDYRNAHGIRAVPWPLLVEICELARIPLTKYVARLIDKVFDFVVLCRFQDRDNVIRSIVPPGDPERT